MELDELSSEWPLCRLADLCEIRIGKTPARANRRYWDNGTNAWAAISDLNGSTLLETEESITDLAIQECRCKPVERGTLLFSFKLTIGKMAFAGRRLFMNEAIAALPIREGVYLESQFLALALKVVPLLSEASDAAKGVTLNKGSLAEIQIPVPPLVEQQRIVARAEALTRRLDQARQLHREVEIELAAFVPALLAKAFRGKL